ncbi:MAG: hypothetical protein JZU52_12740 [Lamprocystis purpurea]|jgi:hypothetical protein|uniref:hypothetical protein n=1 Tax=Lamprocystis purpurea TaxID=61598 RepID=UPI0003A01F3D|nr:hypothetical protein [Lamprocystis purpurea]MBV5274463.1 hypothetical protein [Lamprocystis purpurea]
MQLIRPAAMTLTAATAPLSDETAWLSTRTYAIGARVSVATADWCTDYEAVQAGTNNAPATNPTYWLDLGASNRYKMLDASVSSATKDTTAVTVTVAVEQRCSHLGLFGLTGAKQVTVEQALIANGAAPWSMTRSLARSGGSASWSDWWFTQFEYVGALVLAFPRSVGNFALTVTVAGDADTMVGVGHLAIGRAVWLGETLVDAEVGITDYSRKETDEWGETQLVQRAYAKRATLRLTLPDAHADTVQAQLAAVRAVPVIWDCNGPDTAFESLRIFGIYKEFALQLGGLNQTTCTLNLEGMT